MDLQALWLTLRLAAVTTVVLLIVAIPLAWWITCGRSASRNLIQSLVALPLVLPPTVLGFYLLVLLGPLTAPGRLIIRLLGHPLAFSFFGLVLGSVIYSLPFAVQPLVAGFRSVEGSYLDAASGLGIPPLTSFRTIVLPMSYTSIVAAAVLTFTHTVGEFGVVLMLGGNLPGVTRTLSISLYDQVEDGRYAEANHTALFLIAASLLALVAIYATRPNLDRV